MYPSISSLLCALFLLAPLPIFNRPLDIPEPEKVWTPQLPDGTPLSGTVLTPEGFSAEGATVALATHANVVAIFEGKFRKQQNPNNPIDYDTTTDKEGKFKFAPIFFQNERPRGFALPPPEKTGEFADYAVNVLHESGFRRLTQQEMEATIIGRQPIILERWGRIEGTVYDGTKPTAGVNVHFDSNFLRPGTTPMAFWRYNTTSDKDGKFVLEKVPTGSGTIKRVTLIGRNSYNIGTKIDVNDAVPAIVKIGGVGRHVIGKLVPDVALKEALYKDSHLVKLCAQVDKPDSKAYREHYNKAVPESIRMEPDFIKRRKMLEDWENTTEEGKAFAPKRQEYEAKDEAYQRSIRDMKLSGVSEAGTYRIDDVLEGKWQLEVFAHNHGGWQPSDEPLLIHRFEMPPIPNGVSDEPLDVGTLTLMRLE